MDVVAQVQGIQGIRLGSIRVRRMSTQDRYAWVIMEWLTAVNAIEVDVSAAIFARPSEALLAGEQRLVALLP